MRLELAAGLINDHGLIFDLGQSRVNCWSYFVVSFAVLFRGNPDDDPANAAVLVDDVFLAGNGAFGQAGRNIDGQVDHRRWLAALDDELALDRAPALG